MGRWSTTRGCHPSDAFPDAAGRQAHLDGPIAAALMENADRLLAEAPQIMAADVLAAKLPG